jgi:hypothetical protein
MLHRRRFQIRTGLLTMVVVLASVSVIRAGMYYDLGRPSW